MMTWMMAQSVLSASLQVLPDLGSGGYTGGEGCSSEGPQMSEEMEWRSESEGRFSLGSLGQSQDRHQAHGANPAEATEITRACEKGM